MGTQAYAVIIEWDGQRAPSRWYRRLHQMALRVRGDENLSPYVRRQDGPGIIVQEGAIVVPSHSLARALALLARRMADEELEHPENVAVKIGEVTFDDAIQATPADEAALARLQAALGRRGKPLPPSEKVVVCYEDLSVHARTASRIANCPSCGGLNIYHREGAPHCFADPGGPVFDAWLRTRFATGRWEPPLEAGGSCGVQSPPLLIHIAQPKENEAAEWLAQSPLVQELGHYPRELAFDVLDAVLVARSHWSQEQRAKARSDAVVRYLMQGGDPSGISLGELPQPDLLDAAGPLGADKTAELLLRAAATVLPLSPQLSLHVDA